VYIWYSKLSVIHKRTALSMAASLGLLAVSGAAGWQSPSASTTPAAGSSKPAAVPPETGELTDGAGRVAKLLESLAQFDIGGRSDSQKIGFELPERAVNEYLAYALRSHARPGIRSITVKLLPGNELSALVGLDLAALLKWNAELIPENLRPLLNANTSVRVNLSFEVSGGLAAIRLKSIQDLDGRPLALDPLGNILQAIGMHQPESLDPKRPIPLPFGLKRVWTSDRLIAGTT
jgi:hypothetical protein